MNTSTLASRTKTPWRVTHGETLGGHTKEYTAWANAKSRCTNRNDPGFKRYGGRGIKMCARWLRSYEAFLADMGRAPAGWTLERSNNNLGYTPGNCIWAPRLAQANNHRGNRLLRFRGVRRTIAQWARILKMPKDRIRSRLRYGWSVLRTLTTPLIPPHFAASRSAVARQNRKPSR